MSARRHGESYNLVWNYYVFVIDAVVNILSETRFDILKMSHAEKHN